jgi:hypothetical protein
VLDAANRKSNLIACLILLFDGVTHSRLRRPLSSILVGCITVASDSDSESVARVRAINDL